MSAAAPPDRAPRLGDLLEIDGGSLYRVLGAVGTTTPGAYLLDGYEIHEGPDGPDVRVRPYGWRNGAAVPAEDAGPAGG